MNNPIVVKEYCPDCGHLVERGHDCPMTERTYVGGPRGYSDLWERIKAVQKRNRQEYEWLARQTGKSIAEIEADLTAPDPVFTQEESPAVNGA